MDRSKALRILRLTGHYTDTDLRKAYRQRAKETHPDINQGNSIQFKAVDKAYRYLKEKKTEITRRPRSRGRSDGVIRHGDTVFSYTGLDRGSKPGDGRVFHGDTIFSYR